jgi:hypothetical protein
MPRRVIVCISSRFRTSLSHRIAEYNIVELREPVDDAPMGVPGRVLEFHGDDIAMVEILEPELAPRGPRPRPSPSSTSSSTARSAGFHGSLMEASGAASRPSADPHAKPTARNYGQ